MRTGLIAFLFAVASFLPWVASTDRDAVSDGSEMSTTITANGGVISTPDGGS